MAYTGQHADTIVRELEGLVSAAALISEQVDAFAKRAAEARRIFVAGAGRSGLMGKAFAMRLMHLGLTAHVVGESTTPGIGSGDILVLGSGSGETGSLISMAEKAQRAGASVLLVTIHPGSSIGRLADEIAALPAAAKEAAASSAVTVQPMGSLFEQGLLIFYDAVVLRLMELKEMDGPAMYASHANLE